ncbi:MAG TPA: hypothetical protein VIM17_01985 [Jatrophihabitantaceae bacterium]
MIGQALRGRPISDVAAIAATTTTTNNSAVSRKPNQPNALM